jgi:hypothetical protein
MFSFTFLLAPYLLNAEKGRTAANLRGPSAEICSERKFRAVPQLKRFVIDIPMQRSGFETRAVHVGFVVEKVALGHVFSEYLG